MSTVKSAISAWRLFGIALAIVPALAAWSGGAAWAQRGPEETPTREVALRIGLTASTFPTYYQFSE